MFSDMMRSIKLSFGVILHLPSPNFDTKKLLEKNKTQPKLKAWNQGTRKMGSKISAKMVPHLTFELIAARTCNLKLI